MNKIDGKDVMKSLLDKFELYGEKSLSDLEILFILLGKRNTNKIIKLYEEISKRKDLYSCMYDLQISELINVYNFTKNEARKFKVICEFAKRFNTPINMEKKVIKSAQDVNNLFAAYKKKKKNEKLKLVVLNTKNVIKRVVEITNGKQDSVTFDIKCILLETIKTGYNKIILIHNHPSGDSKPSADDILVTKKIKEMSEIIGIKLLDHIIIGDNEYTSIIYG